jgi:hypothetical protein
LNNIKCKFHIIQYSLDVFVDFVGDGAGSVGSAGEWWAAILSQRETSSVADITQPETATQPTVEAEPVV